MVFLLFFSARMRLLTPAAAVITPWWRGTGAVMERRGVEGRGEHEVEMTHTHTHTHTHTDTHTL